MGNWCGKNNSNESRNQITFPGEMMTDGTSEGREPKFYQTNQGKFDDPKYSNFMKIVKEQAEIISETDFENIITSQFPFLNRIIYPENYTYTPSKNTFILPPIKFPSGEIYKGSWNSVNKRHGFGISISSDGNTLFKGIWDLDKIGNFGLFLEKNGDYYLGQLKEGKFEGKGELNIEGVSKYKGDFEYDLPNGKGIFEDFENLYKYNGDWEMGYKNGKGVLEFHDGTIYEGEFEYDLPHGKGSFEDFENLYKYNGDWEMGYKNGKGVLEFLDGTIYEGEFKNDLYDGTGALKFSNGDKYEGEFKEGNIKGKGKFVWNDGKRYDGEYEDFMKNGFGKFYWSEKKYYEGQWLNNKQHGKGLIRNDDKEIEGIFRFGKIIKGQ